MFRNLTLTLFTFKQPIRTLARELSKVIPGLGQIIAPSIAVVMIEAAGWVAANELEEKLGEKKRSQAAAKKPAASTRRTKNAKGRERPA